MAYRFEFNRFVDIAVPVLEDSGITFDYELSVSTDSEHISSCCCDACEPELDPEDIDYVVFDENDGTNNGVLFDMLNSDPTTVTHTITGVSHNQGVLRYHRHSRRGYLCLQIVPDYQYGYQYHHR